MTSFDVLYQFRDLSRRVQYCRWLERDRDESSIYRHEYIYNYLKSIQICQRLDLAEK